MKPPSPLLAPEQQPLKPVAPLQPKNTPKTPLSHPQRRYRFHLRLSLREQRRWQFQQAHITGLQRRWRFQTTAPRSATSTAGVKGAGGTRWPGWLRSAAPNDVRPPSLTGGGARPGHSQAQASPDWRPPRGLQGLAGLRVGAPSHTSATKRRRCEGRRRVRRARRASRSTTPSRRLACGDLAGGRALRRPEHQRRHKHKPHNRPGTPKGRVPKYPPLVGSLSHCLVEAYGRMTVSPGDGDASTGTCRQQRPLPGPLRRSGRRSRCAQGAGPGRCSAWWPGRRARRNRSSHR